MLPWQTNKILLLIFPLPEMPLTAVFCRFPRPCFFDTYYPWFRAKMTKQRRTRQIDAIISSKNVVKTGHSYYHCSKSSTACLVLSIAKIPVPPSILFPSIPYVTHLSQRLCNQVYGWLHIILDTVQTVNGADAGQIKMGILRLLQDSHLFVKS